MIKSEYGWEVRNISYRVDGEEILLAAIIVPHTDGLLAIHPTRPRGGGRKHTAWMKNEAWTITHTPTGKAFYNNFRSQQEAEDVACWIWHNTTDKEGLREDCDINAIAALGYVVRKRFASAGLLRHYKICPTMGKKKLVKVLPDEGYFTRRLMDLQHQTETLETTARMLNQREQMLNDRSRLIMDQGEETAKGEEELEMRRRELRHELSREETRLRDNAENLHYIQTSIVNALRTCDPENELDDQPLGRALRKIEIRTPSIELAPGETH